MVAEGGWVGGLVGGGAKEDDNKKKRGYLLLFHLYELEAQIVEGCTTVLVKDLSYLSA